MSDTSIEEIADITYRREETAWRFAVDEAAAIDAHWHMLVAKNPYLFNGRVLLMHRNLVTERAHGRVLEGSCFEAEYKAFLAWRDFGFPDDGVRNCFAMPALRSIDGAFILGEMAPSTASPGRIYFPAGTPEPADIRADLVDLEGNVLRELAEETGIGSAEVALSPGWTIVSEGPRLACMKIAQSALPAAAIVDRIADFLAQEAEPELTRVVPVFSPDDFDTEHMPAFMLAYMRHAFDAGR